MNEKPQQPKEEKPIGDIGKKVLEIIHKEKGSSDNPGTIEEAQKDLKKLGIVSEVSPEITSAPIATETKPAPKPPEDLPIAPETANILEEIKSPQKEKIPKIKEDKKLLYITAKREADDLGKTYSGKKGELKKVEKALEKAKGQETKIRLQKAVEELARETESLKIKFEKAKQKRDELKNKSKKPAPTVKKPRKGGEKVIKGSLIHSELIESQIKNKNSRPDYGVEDYEKNKLIAKKEEQKINETEKAEFEEIKAEVEKMPEEERQKIGIGFRNAGFFIQEWKSNAMAKLCGIFGNKDGKNSKDRFFTAMANTYEKDANIARQKIEQREESKSKLLKLQDKGYLFGNILKYGRTIADVVGWTAGSPFRYTMIGAMFFSRGAEAAKEARLMDEKVIEKTRISDIDQAVEEAWKVYEQARIKSITIKAGAPEWTEKEFEEKYNNPSAKLIEKAYIENLPEDLLNRLKKFEPGTATGIASKIAQKILKKDIEFAIKHGKFSEASFERRLKELDRMVSQCGTVDAWAMAGRYSESAGKAVIAGLQIESIHLLIKNLPHIVEKLSSISDLPSHETPLNEAFYGEMAQPELPTETSFAGKPNLLPSHEISSTGKPTLLPSHGGGTPTTPTEIPTETQTTEPLNELTTVKKGEGYWQPVYRQLDAQLHENPENFGLKAEDLEDAAKIKKVLNTKTMNLLVKNGIIDAEKGTELRIASPDTGVYVDNDGNITTTAESYEAPFGKSGSATNMEPQKVGGLEIEESGKKIVGGKEILEIEPTGKKVGGLEIEGSGKKLNAEMLEPISKDLSLSKDAWEIVRENGNIENIENYKAIAKVPIKKLFEEIPPGKTASESWSQSKSINLPSKGVFGLTYSKFEDYYNLKKYIEFIKKPGPEDMNKTVDQFLAEKIK